MSETRISDLPALNAQQALDLSALLQSDLKQLLQECSKKYPDIQQAVEQAILKLRTVTSSDLSPVECQELFNSDLVVRPLLLACGSASSSLAILSLTSLQHLLLAFPSPRLVETTVTIASMLKDLPDTRIHVKLIQTLLLAITPGTVSHSSTLASALPSAMGVCTSLLRSTDRGVSGAAYAALRRVSELFLESAQNSATHFRLNQSHQSDASNTNTNSNTNSKSMSTLPLSAYPQSVQLVVMYLNVICAAVKRDDSDTFVYTSNSSNPSSFGGLASLPPTVAAELLLSALDYTSLLTLPPLTHMLGGEVVALVTEVSSMYDSFVLQATMVDVMVALVSRYSHVDDLHVVVELLVKMVSRGMEMGRPLHEVWLYTHAAAQLVKDPRVVYDLYRNYEYTLPLSTNKGKKSKRVRYKGYEVIETLPTSVHSDPSSTVSGQATVSLLLTSASAIISMSILSGIKDVSSLRKFSKRHLHPNSLAPDVIPVVTMEHCVVGAVDVVVNLAKSLEALFMQFKLHLQTRKSLKRERKAQSAKVNGIVASDPLSTSDSQPPSNTPASNTTGLPPIEIDVPITIPLETVPTPSVIQDIDSDSDSDCDSCESGDCGECGECAGDGEDMDALISSPSLIMNTSAFPPPTKRNLYVTSTRPVPPLPYECKPEYTVLFALLSSMVMPLAHSLQTTAHNITEYDLHLELIATLLSLCMMLTSKVHEVYYTNALLQPICRDRASHSHRICPDDMVDQTEAETTNAKTVVKSDGEESTPASPVPRLHTIKCAQVLAEQRDSVILSLLSLTLPTQPHTLTHCVTPAVLDAVVVESNMKQDCMSLTVDQLLRRNEEPLPAHSPVQPVQLKHTHTASATLSDLLTLLSLQPQHLAAVSAVVTLCYKHFDTLGSSWRGVLYYLSVIYTVLNFLAQRNNSAPSLSQPHTAPTSGGMMDTFHNILGGGTQTPASAVTVDVLNCPYLSVSPDLLAQVPSCIASIDGLVSLSASLPCQELMLQFCLAFMQVNVAHLRNDIGSRHRGKERDGLDKSDIVSLLTLATTTTSNSNSHPASVSLPKDRNDSEVNPEGEEDEAEGSLDDVAGDGDVSSETTHSNVHLGFSTGSVAPIQRLLNEPQLTSITNQLHLLPFYIFYHIIDANTTALTSLVSHSAQQPQLRPLHSISSKKKDSEKSESVNTDICNTPNRLAVSRSFMQLALSLVMQLLQSRSAGGHYLGVVLLYRVISSALHLDLLPSDVIRILDNDQTPLSLNNALSLDSEVDVSSPDDGTSDLHLPFLLSSIIFPDPRHTPPPSSSVFDPHSRTDSKNGDSKSEESTGSLDDGVMVDGVGDDVVDDIDGKEPNVGDSESPSGSDTDVNKSVSDCKTEELDDSKDPQSVGEGDFVHVSSDETTSTSVSETGSKPVTKPSSKNPLPPSHLLHPLPPTHYTYLVAPMDKSVHYAVEALVSDSKSNSNTSTASLPSLTTLLGLLLTPYAFSHLHPSHCASIGFPTFSTLFSLAPSLSINCDIVLPFLSSLIDSYTPSLHSHLASVFHSASVLARHPSSVEASFRIFNRILQDYPQYIGVNTVPALMQTIYCYVYQCEGADCTGNVGNSIGNTNINVNSTGDSSKSANTQGQLNANISYNAINLLWRVADIVHENNYMPTNTLTNIDINNNPNTPLSSSSSVAVTASPPSSLTLGRDDSPKTSSRDLFTHVYDAARTFVLTHIHNFGVDSLYSLALPENLDDLGHSLGAQDKACLLSSPFSRSLVHSHPSSSLTPQQLQRCGLLGSSSLSYHSLLPLFCSQRMRDSEKFIQQSVLLDIEGENEGASESEHQYDYSLRRTVFAWMLYNNVGSGVQSDMSPSLTSELALLLDEEHVLVEAVDALIRQSIVEYHSLLSQIPSFNSSLSTPSPPTDTQSLWSVSKDLSSPLGPGPHFGKGKSDVNSEELFNTNNYGNYISPSPCPEISTTLQQRLQLVSLLWPSSPPQWTHKSRSSPVTMRALELHGFNLRATHHKFLLLCFNHLLSIAHAPNGDVRNTAARLLFKFLDTYITHLDDATGGTIVNTVSLFMDLIQQKDFTANNTASPKFMKQWGETKLLCVNAIAHTFTRAMTLNHMASPPSSPPSSLTPTLSVPLLRVGNAKVWPVAVGNLIRLLATMCFTPADPSTTTVSNAASSLATAALKAMETIALNRGLSLTHFWTDVEAMFTLIVRRLQLQLEVYSLAHVCYSVQHACYVHRVDIDDIDDSIAYNQGQLEMRKQGKHSSSKPIGKSREKTPANKADVEKSLVSQALAFFPVVSPPYPECPAMSKELLHYTLPILNDTIRSLDLLSLLSGPYVVPVSSSQTDDSPAPDAFSVVCLAGVTPNKLPSLCSEWIRVAATITNTIAKVVFLPSLHLTSPINPAAPPSGVQLQVQALLRLTFDLASREHLLPLSLSRASAAMLGVGAVRCRGKESVLCHTFLTAITNSINNGHLTTAAPFLFNYIHLNSPSPSSPSEVIFSEITRVLPLTPLPLPVDPRSTLTDNPLLASLRVLTYSPYFPPQPLSLLVSANPSVWQRVVPLLTDILSLLTRSAKPSYSDPLSSTLVSDPSSQSLPSASPVSTNESLYTPSTSTSTLLTAPTPSVSPSLVLSDPLPFLSSLLPMISHTQTLLLLLLLSPPLNTHLTNTHPLFPFVLPHLPVFNDINFINTPTAELVALPTGPSSTLVLFVVEMLHLTQTHLLTETLPLLIHTHAINPIAAHFHTYSSEDHSDSQLEDVLRVVTNRNIQETLRSVLTYASFYHASETLFGEFTLVPNPTQTVAAVPNPLSTLSALWRAHQHVLIPMSSLLLCVCDDAVRRAGLNQAMHSITHSSLSDSNSPTPTDSLAVIQHANQNYLASVAGFACELVYMLSGCLSRHKLSHIVKSRRSLVTTMSSISDCAQSTDASLSNVGPSSAGNSLASVPAPVTPSPATSTSLSHSHSHSHSHSQSTDAHVLEDIIDVDNDDHLASLWQRRALSLSRISSNTITQHIRGLIVEIASYRIPAELEIDDVCSPLYVQSQTDREVRAKTRQDSIDATTYILQVGPHKNSSRVDGDVKQDVDGDMSLLAPLAARVLVDMAVVILQTYIQGETYPLPPLPFDSYKNLFNSPRDPSNLDIYLYNIPVPTALEVATVVDLLTNTSLSPVTADHILPDASNPVLTHTPLERRHLLLVQPFLMECIQSNDVQVRMSVFRALQTATTPILQTMLPSTYNSQLTHYHQQRQVEVSVPQDTSAPDSVVLESSSLDSDGISDNVSSEYIQDTVQDPNSDSLKLSIDSPSSLP